MAWGLHSQSYISSSSGQQSLFLGISLDHQTCGILGKSCWVVLLSFAAATLAPAFGRCKLGIRRKTKIIFIKVWGEAILAELCRCWWGLQTANKEWKQFIKQSTLSWNNTCNLALIVIVHLIITSLNLGWYSSIHYAPSGLFLSNNQGGQYGWEYGYLGTGWQYKEVWRCKAKLKLVSFCSFCISPFS